MLTCGILKGRIEEKKNNFKGIGTQFGVHMSKVAHMASTYGDDVHCNSILAYFMG